MIDKCKRCERERLIEAKGLCKSCYVMERKKKTSICKCGHKHYEEREGIEINGEMVCVKYPKCPCKKFQGVGG